MATRRYQGIIGIDIGSVLQIVIGNGTARLSFDITQKRRADKLVIAQTPDILDVIGGKDELALIGKILRGTYLEGRIIRSLQIFLAEASSRLE